MKTTTMLATRPLVSLKNLQRGIGDATRWQILDLLQQRGPMTTQFIAAAVGGSMQNVSKHLIFMRDAGMLEQRMGRLYAIPDAFLVEGERTVDFGPIILRLDQA